MKIMPAIRLLAAVAALGFAALPAAAQEPKAVATFESWTAYTYKTKKGPVCYIVSQPQKSEASRQGIKRDPAYFIVTNRPGVRHEVNTIIGYPFKKGAPVMLTTDDGAKFRLYSSKDGAWSDGPATDRKIVAAMKAGRTMVITGISARGTKTTDTYSLIGVKAALAKIDQLCRK